MEMTQQLTLGGAYVPAGDVPEVFMADCEMIADMLANCQITVPEENRFFVRVDCGQAAQRQIKARSEQYQQELTDSRLLEGQEALAYTGLYDFGHTCAGWESIIRLGICGLRGRIGEYAAKAPAEKQRFFGGLIRVWDGALRFMERAAEAARRSGKPEMSEGLRNLTKRAPANLFEAMQTAIVYYHLQVSFDGTALRTLGRLDQLLYPYFQKENPERAERLIADFLAEIDGLKVKANVPFALGGTDAQGKSLVNELTYRLLEGYRAGNTAYVKLHLLCAENTPEDLLRYGLDTVRSGKNSIVFLSDARVIESLEKLGAAHGDAVRYHVVGCYECGAEGEITCSCNARVNLPKALELALNRGRDMLTGKQLGPENDGDFPAFEGLLAEFYRQCAHLCRCAMKLTDLHEAHYGQMHSAPIMSATYLSALERGQDLYCGNGAKYSNSSLNALGLATAVDSLAAIRKLVYEDKTVTLAALVEILKADWAGQEPLRLRIRNRFPKYGMGDPKTDALAAETVALLAKTVSGQPNAKGGVYRLGLFSIDWRWEFGKKTAASADGRRCAEPISQNTGASFGADREGATAHLLSAAALDTSHTPNGAIVDIDLHASSVRGSNGLEAMQAALKTYFRLGGFAVQYNVLDGEVLKRAKADPQAYPNLQVRLCGWNVLFSTLSEKEKDEFIARSVRQG